MYGNNISSSYGITNSSAITKTFGLIGMSFLVTVVAGTLFQASGFAHMASMKFMLIAGVIAQFVLIFTLGRAKSERAAALQLFTIAGIEGCILDAMIAPIFAIRPDIVLMAAGGTVAATMGATIYALVTKRNLLSMTGFLFTGLIIVLAASLINLFVHSSLMVMTISGVSVLLFTMYIAYDVQSVIKGRSVSPAYAALSIYLDIINLFLNLLQLLLELNKSSD